MLSHLVIKNGGENPHENMQMCVIILYVIWLIKNER